MKSIEVQEILDKLEQETEALEDPEKLGKITDAGNASLLVEAHMDDLRYCFEMKKWFFWDGKRWQVDEKQFARVLMEETMRKRVAQTVTNGGSTKDISEACACLDTHRLTNGLREAEKN
jgi:phage/plasmid-associated DNA primase